MVEYPVDDARDLLTFVDASPSPYHAATTVSDRLEAVGFRALDERAPWFEGTGRFYVRRGGSLIAWALDDPVRLDEGFRIVGAHTDSPNLRVKPRPDCGRAGFRQLGVEVYGGALFNSWLDRDLGLSGRVAVRPRGEPEADLDDSPVRDPRTPDVRLLRVDRPLLRVPQLAIHLDRGVNENGLKLNPQQHLVPLWGLGLPTDGEFAAFLAAELDIDPADVLSWDVMCHDVTPGALLGVHDEFVSSARLDNLLSCWAATRALMSSLEDVADGPRGVPVMTLFDHEEVGSESATGAAGATLPTLLERIAVAAGRDREGLLQALARSYCVSADGAHATNPNYAERHEPDHHIRLNGGPVIKSNANERYATDAPTSAFFKLTCDEADVPVQEFVVRTDMACGSTIGPITAARLGIPTVDVGVAQLAMHSARELCGSADPQLFARALTGFFTGGGAVADRR